jgi:transposase
LHSHGLLRGSFRPEGDCLILRGYTRHRTNVVQARSTQLHLMHKAMTQMNIQLRQVVSDIDGETGMKIIRSIVAGEKRPMHLAEYRDHRCKKSKQEIAQALEGNFRDEHIFSLKQALQTYDHLSTQITECDEQIRKNIESWKNHVNETPVEAPEVKKKHKNCS